MEKNIKAFSFEKEIWNKAVVATLIELRKYDGIISIKDRDTLTDSILKKVAHKGFTHNFKKLQY